MNDMENTAELSKIKELSDLKLKSLEDALSAVLFDQVGGDFTVRLHRFQYNGVPGPALEIDFVVYDRSSEFRPAERDAVQKRFRH